MTSDERAAFYVRVMREVREVLAMPDRELDRERRLIREAQEAGA